MDYETDKPSPFVMQAPGRRAKRLPKGMVCESCGGPMRSLPGYWLGRGVYAAECKAGCWACAACGEMHAKDYVCNIRVLADRRLNGAGPGTLEFDDELPF